MRKVVVNGIPGNMASKVAEHIIRSDKYTLLPFSLTGPEIRQKSKTILGKKIRLFTPEKRGELVHLIDNMRDPNAICIDYTHPGAVMGNVLFYIREQLDFIVGTTGLEMERVVEEMELEEKRYDRNGIGCIVAPNMAPQIVEFQSVMERYASKNKGKLKGCTLKIVESHQGPDPAKGFVGKADTSGTAKAVVNSFNDLGLDFSVDQIVKIRDWKVQKDMGVPSEYRYGHGWHTYELKTSSNKKNVLDLGRTLATFRLANPVFQGYSKFIQGDYLMRVSPDETVMFKCMITGKGRDVTFAHNVNGREIYAAGTIKALDFLLEKIENYEADGKVYTMMDVLSR